MGCDAMLKHELEPLDGRRQKQIYQWRLADLEVAIDLVGHNEAFAQWGLGGMDLAGGSDKAGRDSSAGWCGQVRYSDAHGRRRSGGDRMHGQHGAVLCNDLVRRQGGNGRQSCAKERRAS